MTSLAISELPTRLPNGSTTRVVATGAFLKNRACLIDGRQVYWSALHGDLSKPDACRALDRSVDKLLSQVAGVHTIAHDLHPDFYSARLAVSVSNRDGLLATPIQHHHAHIASVIAERGITAPVIGIALDGFGLGTDGQAWGGELLRVDGGASAHRWRRLTHLQQLRLPGGDKAVLEPWRLAAALLFDLGRCDEIEGRFAPRVGTAATAMVCQMLKRNLNCPTSSSAGRWFDTAAAALGLCTRQSREGEAAEALEQTAQRFLDHHPDFELVSHEPDLQAVVASLFAIDTSDMLSVERGAAMFHLALSQVLARCAITVAHEHAIGDVVLGGGCFVNRVLRDRLTESLRSAGLRVHLPAASLCGDTAIALGQAWIAACLHQELEEQNQCPLEETC